MANEQEFFDKQMEQDLIEEKFKEEYRKANTPENIAKKIQKEEEEDERQSVFDSFMDNIDEILPQAQKGMGESINEIYKFITQTDQGPIPASELTPATTTGGAIAREIGHFSTMFIPLLGQVGRATQAVPWLAKLGKSSPRFKNAIDGLIAGAGTDFASYDPNTENLANVIANSIESYPQAKKLIATYLATDKNNSQLENRFKNALVGMIIGTGIEGAFATAGAIKTSAPKIADYIISLKNEHPEAIKKFLEPLKNERGAIDLKSFQFNPFKPKPQYQQAEDFGNISGRNLGQNYEDMIRLEEKRVGEQKAKALKTLETSEKFTKEQIEKMTEEQVLENAVKLKSTLFDRIDLSDEEIKQILETGSEKNIWSPNKDVSFDPDEVPDVAKRLIENDMVDPSLTKSINMNRLNGEAEIEGVIATMADGLETSGIMTAIKGGGEEGVLSERIVKHQARLMGANPNKLWESTKGLPARMLAGRNLMMRSADYLVELANKYKDNDTPENLIKLRFHNMRHGAIQAMVMGSQTNIARALQAMRIIAKADDARLGGVNNLAEMWGDKEVGKTFAQAVINAHKKGYEAVNKMSRLTTHAVTRKAIVGAYLNGLLSSTLTTLRNFSGNAIAMGESLASRRIAEMATKSKRAKGMDVSELPQEGGSDAMLSALYNSHREVNAVFWETFDTGIPSSGVTKTDFFENQLDLLELTETQIDQYPMFSKAMLWLERTSRPISKSLVSMDEAMKFYNYRMKVNVSAYDRAIKEAGDDIEYFNYLYDHYRLNPPEEMQNFAKAFARDNAFQTRTAPFKQEKGDRDIYSGEFFAPTWGGDLKNTFTQPDQIGLIGQGMGLGMDSLAYGAKAITRGIETDPGLAWLKILIPFVNTPFQLLDRSVALTPGLRKASIHYRKQLASSDPAEKALLDAKVKFSQGLFFSFFASALFSDNITGAGSTDYKQGKYTEETQPEYSWRIPFTDIWIAYNQLDPITLPLGIAANMAQSVKQLFYIDDEDELSSEENTQVIQNLGNVVSTFVFENTKLMADRTYFTNMRDLWNLVSSATGGDPSEIQRNLHRVGSNLLRAFPGFSYWSGARKEVSKLIDPFEKQLNTDTAMGELLNTTVQYVPGASYFLERKKGMLGEDMLSTSQSSSDYWRNHQDNLDLMSVIRDPMSNIAKLRKKETEPLYQALTDYNINYRHPSDLRFIKGVRLADHEIRAYGEAYGKYNQSINDSLKNNTYFSLSMNDAERQAQLRTDLERHAKYARMDTVNTFPRIQNESDTQKQVEEERMEAGIQKGDFVNRANTKIYGSGDQSTNKIVLDEIIVN